jgi:hypothetical protein
VRVPGTEDLSEPDLQIAELRLWIHGREFEDSSDYWDGNWLRVTAECRSRGSRVSADGPILHLSEIAGLLHGCERLYETLEGRAELVCIEPNLGVVLEAETGGRIRIETTITPDHMTERHTYRDGFDQTYLPPIIAACRRILRDHPLRNPPKAK